jgi:hypothetical protein
MALRASNILLTRRMYVCRSQGFIRRCVLHGERGQEAKKKDPEAQVQEAKKEDAA